MNCKLKILAKRVYRLNLKGIGWDRLSGKRVILLLVFHTNAYKQFPANGCSNFKRIYETVKGSIEGDGFTIDKNRKAVVVFLNTAYSFIIYEKNSSNDYLNICKQRRSPKDEKI